MEKRESIIRKLNALKAKANDPSIKDTPEAISAMQKFNELMQRYNLDLTDIEVKTTGVKFGDKFASKGKDNHKECHPIAWAILSIEKVANVEILRTGWNEYKFVGTPSDIEYGQFLYNIIYNTCERAALAYKMSVDYQRDINALKLKGDKVIWNFKYGFVIACYHALEAMLKEAPSTGTDLVVVKNDLIKSFLEERGIKYNGEGKAVKLSDDMGHLRDAGYREGNKLKLRQELN